MQKFVPLFMAVGTIITQKHVDAAKIEAKEYPVGSKQWMLLMKYVERLEEKIKKQDNLNFDSFVKK